MSKNTFFSSRRAFESIPEPGASLLPFALSAPLLAVVHAVHFAALFVLPAYSARRYRVRLRAVRPGGQLNDLVGRLWYSWDGARKDVLTNGANELSLVLRVFVRRPGHVSVR